MPHQSRLAADARYMEGVRRAVDTIATSEERSRAVRQVAQIADDLRKEDPRFLYREFYFDTGVTDWDEFRLSEADDV